MIHPATMSTPGSNARKVALFTVFTALCLALQLAPRPPNVEFTSFFTFLVGLVWGVRDGAFFGGFVMFANGFLSSYGLAGFNLPFQVAGMAVAGILGGIYRRRMPGHLGAGFCAETAVIGAIGTLIYDFITNLGVGFSQYLAGVDLPLAVLTAIAYGIVFSLIHVSSNAAVFGILTLPSLKGLEKLVKVTKNG